MTLDKWSPVLSTKAQSVLEFVSQTNGTKGRTRKAILEAFRSNGVPSDVDNALRTLETEGLIKQVGDEYCLTPAGKTRQQSNAPTKPVARTKEVEAAKTSVPAETTPASAALAGTMKLGKANGASPAVPPTAIGQPASTLQVNIGEMNGGGKIIVTVDGEPLKPAAAAKAAPAKNGKSPHAIDAGDPILEHTAKICLKNLPGINDHPLRTNAHPFTPAPGGAVTESQRTKWRIVNEIHFMLGFYDRKDVPPIPVRHGDALGRCLDRANPQVDIDLSHDATISHEQCEFEIKVDRNGVFQLFVKDLDSTNGTVVNGVPLPSNKFSHVPARSRIRIGNTTLVVIQVLWEQALVNA